MVLPNWKPAALGLPILKSNFAPSDIRALEQLPGAGAATGGGRAFGRWSNSRSTRPRGGVGGEAAVRSRAEGGGTIVV